MILRSRSRNCLSQPVVRMTLDVKILSSIRLLACRLELAIADTARFKREFQLESIRICDAGSAKEEVDADKCSCSRGLTLVFNFIIIVFFIVIIVIIDINRVITY
jgi:hypothetical protein